MDRNSAAPHDNIDVRLNTKISFYGPVVAIGSIPVVGVGLFLFILWTSTHWSAAIALSAWLVYGFFSLVGLTVLILIAALAVKIVIHPLAGAYERHIEARGQAKRNRVVYAQENAMVVEVIEGTLQVVPLFPQQMIEPPKQEPWSDKATVLELFKTQGLSLRDIAARTGVSYYQVQKWTSEEKSKTE